MTRISVALLVVLTAMACGGRAAAPPSPSPSASFTMGSMGGSGVTGTGQVFNGTGSVTVSIQIHGLKASSSHISHVHVGNCAKPGGIACALLQVVADSSGNATATSTVPEYYSMPTVGWYVNVYFGPDLTEAEYAPSVSCGDLPAF